jgi:hypothetical protein
MGLEQDIVKGEKVVVRAQEPQPAVGAVDHVIDESSGSDAMRSGATVRWAARRGSNRRLAPWPWSSPCDAAAARSDGANARVRVAKASNGSRDFYFVRVRPGGEIRPYVPPE